MGEVRSAGRPTRLTAKGRATRDRIVEVAARLTFERGVARTSLDDVCASAAVGRSQLYHYFTDKAALVQAVIAVQTHTVVEAQTGLDSWAAWEGWRDRMVDLQRQRGFTGGCPIGSLASELADRDERARRDLADGFDRWEEAFRVGLTAMRSAGLLRADADPSLLALATMASLQGGLLLGQTRKEAAPLEAALDAALAHLRSHAARDGDPPQPDAAQGR